jgi:SAM-dependent methyltransferase
VRPTEFAVRVSRVLRNVVRDLRFGKVLAGQQPSAGEHVGARPVVNSDYAALELIFRGRLTSDDVLVDVGCGRGRVLNWWLANGFRHSRIVGLEYDPAVAAATKARLAKYPNVTVIQGNALDHLPEDATVMYLYNPFERPVVAEFIVKVTERYSSRGVRLLYSNCRQVDLFESDPSFRVEIVRIGDGGAAPFDDLAVIDLIPSARRVDQTAIAARTSSREPSPPAPVPVMRPDSST